MSTSKERMDWLANRVHSVGASEVSALLRLPDGSPINPWTSEYTLWAKKTGLLTEEDADETEWQYWGNILEPVICAEYSRETGRQVVDHGRYAVRYSKSCPHLSATLDREVLAIDERGNGCMDAKNVSAWKQADWKDAIPLVYQTQVQAQMEVCGYQWGSAAALIGGSMFRWADVQRDDRFIDLMRRKVAEFWKLVESKTPPPIDDSDSTADSLRRLYAKDGGKVIALSAEAAEWTRTIARCDKALRKIETIKCGAKNRIIDEMKDAIVGVLPEGGGWSFKNQTRKAHSVKESTSRVLRRMAK